MITVITAALVLAILIPFRAAIVDAVATALDPVPALATEPPEGPCERGSAAVGFALVPAWVMVSPVALPHGPVSSV